MFETEIELKKSYNLEGTNYNFHECETYIKNGTPGYSFNITFDDGRNTYEYNTIIHKNVNEIIIFEKEYNWILTRKIDKKFEYNLEKYKKNELKIYKDKEFYSLKLKGKIIVRIPDDYPFINKLLNNQLIFERKTKLKNLN